LLVRAIEPRMIASPGATSPGHSFRDLLASLPPHPRYPHLAVSRPSATTSPTDLPYEPGGASPPTIVDGDLSEPSEASTRGALAPGEAVGRYVILERIGSGGMGVVHAAYDRDLDRRVAIKLLHTTHGPGHSKGQARLLREAQAMARLAHPNVCTVHEVGTYQGRLFVAMEFIDGQTFGQWRRERPRSWRELVAVLQQAGRGLAAAHHQGLVHRDFKPENVLVGRDGRVRVVDFGLARSNGESARLESSAEIELLLGSDSTSIKLTETGALAGTPAYMAPEQFRGHAPDARSDQFAFCVTLWEALYDQRPFEGETRAQLAMAVCKGQLREPPPRDVPAFLRRALRRGLSLRQEDRFPSMDALLTEIDRDPGRTRRRAIAIVLGAVVVAGLSAGVAMRFSAQVEDPCAGGPTRMAGAWDDVRRDEVRAAFDRVDASFAATSRETVERELDAHAERWLEGYRSACEATHVRHEQSSELLDRRMACLDQRLGALAATTELLAQADREAIARSVEAVTALPAPSECDDAERLMAGFAPPRDPTVAEEVEALRTRLARASAKGKTGRAAEGLAEARTVAERAAALEWPPLRAEAALAVGELAATAGEDQVALASLHAAVDEAVASRHDEVLVQAATDLVSFVGVNLSRYDEAERWGRLADAAVTRRGRAMGDAIELARARCMMLADKGEPKAALPHCQEALDLSIAMHGPESPVTGVSHRGLGNARYMAGELAEAEAAYRRATEIFLASHGLDHPEHPTLLNSLAAVCFAQGRGEACVEQFEQALAAAVRSFGPEHPMVADLTNNLATVLQVLGRLDEAEPHARRSLELRRSRFGDGHPGVGAAHRVLAKIAQERGDLPTAREHADRAVEVLRATRGDRHPDVLEALEVRAGILVRAGEVDAGLRDVDEALRLVEALERPSRERAALYLGFAKMLASARPERARELVARAEAEARGDAALVQEISSVRAGLEASPSPTP
jgi:tetratricopeptide (TPR) repeat protein/predicted Ser/Thr protein kinase